MHAILLAIILGAGVHYDNSIADFSGGGLIVGNLQLQCALCSVYGVARTTDAAPYAVLLQGGNSSPTATAGNQTGGALVLAAGLGTRTITVSDYSKQVGGNDTVTVTTVKGGTTTATTLTATVDFACATSNNACATALAAAVDALACVSATASTATVRIVPDPSCSYVNVTIADGAVDGAFATATQGASGKVYLTLPTANLAATCTYGEVSIDNGGATVELCFCAAPDTWYCINVDDTTGPTD